MNVDVIHVTKYNAAIGSRQTNSRSFHPRSVDPSDSISECSIVAIPFGNHFWHSNGRNLTAEVPKCITTRKVGRI